MKKGTHTVFISYRRDGGFETARYLYDNLLRDGYSVTFDIDTLRNGRFDDALLSRIDECIDFIIILNKGCFDRTLDPSFPVENDWMRKELAYAISNNKNVIPIMLGGFVFPDSLPQDIEAVRRYNAPKYVQEYFDAFYERLKKFVVSQVNERHETKDPKQVSGTVKQADEGEFRKRAAFEFSVLRKQNSDFYLAPIPSKKLANAMREMGVAEAEKDVLCIYDGTVFGSAKKGMVVTDRALYFNDGENRLMVSWGDDFQASKGDDETEIVLEDNVATLIGIDGETSSALINAINRLNSFEVHKRLVKKAESGDAEAMCSLGWKYYYGEGCVPDEEKAVEWYKKAMENGDGFSALYLARMVKGKKARWFLNEAIRLWELAAGADDANAMRALGDVYSHDGCRFKSPVDQDFEKAVSWYKKAAERGDVHAQFCMGRYLTNELGKKDPPNYRKWKKLLEAQEIDDQKFCRNVEKAAAYFELIVNAGKSYFLEHALLRLARINRYFDEVEDAKAYYQKAIDNGSEKAPKELEEYTKSEQDRSE